MNRIASILFSCITFISCPAMSSEETSSDMSNVGFMKSPPKEIVGKFPMCDAFLDILWLDKKDILGYAHYEAIVKHKDGSSERRGIWSLVDMNARSPDIAAGDMYQYKRQGKLEPVLDMVRNGTWRKHIRFHTIALRDYYGFSPLLSDHRQTVCAVYPDGQRAWIVEGKTIEQSFGEEQQAELYKKLSDTAGSQIRPDFFKNLWILDVNFDGVNDYLFDRAYFYSLSGKYYEANDKLIWTNTPRNFLVTFPPSNNTCEIPEIGARYITTDGKSYYISNRCNLTEVTTPEASSKQ